MDIQSASEEEYVKYISIDLPSAESDERQALARRFQPIQGWLEPLEGFLLYQWAKHGPGRGIVVELGSFMGRSTCWLAAGSKDAQRGKVVACDTFQGSPEHQAGMSVEVPE
ncbi:MAG: class I SAM-dependent methyltransferase, partial [Magnetococcales bacterium]|nr:class I SAM-dependent methyltransferase [Magnetococcales bacterium]